LVDDDRVELSNLQRQIVHGQDDLKRLKVESARDSLLGLNPNLDIHCYPYRLNKTNALEVIKDYDLILDGSDNFPTRYLLNDAAAFLGLPLIYGSVYRFEGQASVFWVKRGPCYRCLFPTPPNPDRAPSCGEAGVMGVLPGLIGAIQATEALKLLVGGAKTLVGRLLLVDAWTMEFTDLLIEKDPNCPLCGSNPTITELIDYEFFCGHRDVPKGLEAENLTPLELQKRLTLGQPIQIIDIREDLAREVVQFPGALVLNFLDLEKRLSELDPRVETVVVCEIGQKSLFAIRKLKKACYLGRLYNLKGGSNAWIQELGADSLA
jgi:adenylyltransferase/sulfurtransferase